MMPVAAIGPVLMVVIVVVTMMVVAVVVTMMAVTVIVVVVAMVGALLRPKAALHGDDSAALAARQFGECRAVLDIKRVAGKFSEAVLAAEMPGETHQAKRIFGAYLQQLFGRRLHLNKRSILQPKGVTVVDGGLHVEIEMDLGPGLARCRCAWRRLRAAWSRVIVSIDALGFTAGLRTMVATRGMVLSREKSDVEG